MTERYGWDQTPTPDLGLDITKAPADIQKLYKWVIEKMYGKDVASAYGQAMVLTGILAKNAEAMSLFTSGKMDTLTTYVDDMMLEMTDKDIISAPEIIQMRDGEATANDRLERDFNKLDEVLKYRTRLTPDDFEGSDLEKVQQALDFAISNNVIDINLNRTYDLTGGTIYLPEGSFWGRIVFHGGKIIKNDAGYVFDSLGSSRNRHAPQFNNTNFESTVDGVRLFNADKMIRFELNSSKFIRFGLLKTTEYVQTLRLHQCETEILGCDFIDADNGFDVSIVHHRGEQNSTGYKFLKMVTETANGISYFGLRIIDSLLEGYTGTHPIEIGAGYGLVIENNYFEANKETIKIVSGAGTNRIQGSIKNNVFGRNKGTYDVNIDSAIVTAWLELEDNTVVNTVSGKYLCNRIVGNYNSMQTNNLPANTSHYPSGGSTLRETTSHSVTKIDLSGGGIGFRIPLQLKNVLHIYNADNLQWLVNAVGVIGNSVIFRAHLTGILSVDVHVVSGSNKAVLNMDVLSTRNTSGNTNGNTGNPTNFDYFFVETGTKEIDYNAASATIQINFPAFVANAKTKLTFKGIDEIMQNQRVNT